MDRSKEKRLRRRLLRGAAGTAAGAGLVLGGLFNSADELLRPSDDDAAEDVPRAQHVETVSGAASDIRELPLDAEWTLADRARAWIWGLPAAVRAGVLLPLWGVGRGIIELCSLLLTALEPVWQAVLGVVLQAGVLFLLFAVLYKLLFPNAKLGNLFRKGRWLWVLGGAVVLTAADRLLLHYVPEYPAIRIAAIAVSAFLVLLLLWRRLFAGHPAPEQPRKWIDIPKAA